MGKPRIAPMREARLGQRIHIAGTIRYLRGKTDKNAANLECEVSDGTGSLLLVFQGRRRIPGIAVGAPNGVSIAGGQFVPSLQWLSPSFIATELHVSLPGSTTTGKLAPGLHGHSLDSVSVAGTTLQTGSPNSIPATPAPAFTLNFTNSGTNNESNVVCRVAVSGTNDSGQTVVPTTTAGQHATCKVTLSAPPPKGTSTVKATIGAVPGEKNLSNNSQSFPVTFQ